MGAWSAAALAGSGAIGFASAGGVLAASVGCCLPGLALGSGFGRDNSAAFSGVTMMSVRPRPPNLCSAPARASAQLWLRRLQEQELSRTLRYLRAVGESI